MISCKIFFQLMVTVLKEKLNLYFTVVLGLYLKQHLIQSKLQKTSLEPFLEPF